MTTRMLYRLAMVLVALLSSPGASHSRADEDFYLLMFASQRVPRNPNYSHSFATFVRVSCPCQPGANTTLEAHTISWLPVTGIVRTYALLPECGRNWELHETIRWALDNKERVSLWGPYRITPDVFERALQRKQVLESGRVLYKANDTFRRDDRVSNCIHAIGPIGDGDRVRVASPGWGDTASYFLLLELMPWIIDPDQVHDWLVPMLGLQCYPIAYRLPPRQLLLPPRTGFPLFLRDRYSEPTYGPPATRGPAGR